MLNVFREGAKTWASRVLIWFVAVTFVGAAFLVWGQGGSQREDIVAAVGDIYITRAELAEKSRQVERKIKDQLGDQLDAQTLDSLNAPSLAMSALVEWALQLREAKRLGMGVTEAEVRDAIMSMPAFQVDGVFDKRRYTEALRMNGVPIKAFEEDMRRNLLAAKLRERVERAIVAPELEAVGMYLLERQPVVVEYVDIGAASLENAVEVDDKALEEWYAKRQFEFQIPEKREGRAIIANPENFAVTVEASDDEIKEYYEQNKTVFQTKETVTARHILVGVPLGASEEDNEEARAKAQEALERVRAGEDFAAVAKEMSDDPASAPNGGDLGSFSRGQMVQQFDEVVFGLEPGGMSEPFKTDFGWHVAQVISKAPAGVQPLEEVRDKIAARVRDTKAREAAMLAMERAASNLTPENFDEVGGSNPYFDVKSYVVGQGEPVGFLGQWGQAASDAVFGLKAGKPSDIRELGDSQAVFIVDAVTPATTPKLADVRDKAEKRYRTEMSFQIARQVAETIRSAAEEEGKGLKEAAAAQGYEVAETEPFSNATLQDPNNPATGEGMIKEALSAPVGEARIISSSEGALVYSVKERLDVDAASMAADLPKLRDDIQLNKRTRGYTQYLAGLKERAEQNGEIEIYVNLGNEG